MIRHLCFLLSLGLPLLAATDPVASKTTESFESGVPAIYQASVKGVNP